MYSREQSAQVRQAFWTCFGKYMSPVPNAGGETINWINYKSGIRQIFIRANAERDNATVSLEITHNDRVTQQLYFEQLTQYRNLLNNADDWVWDDHALKENGKPYCAITRSLEGVNIYRQTDWPQIISFLKSSLIELDAYWYIVKDLVEIL